MFKQNDQKAVFKIGPIMLRNMLGPVLHNLGPAFISFFARFGVFFFCWGGGGGAETIKKCFQSKTSIFKDTPHVSYCYFFRGST